MRGAFLVATVVAATSTGPASAEFVKDTVPERCRAAASERVNGVERPVLRPDQPARQVLHVREAPLRNLGDEPDAAALLALHHTVDGCPEPIVLSGKLVPPPAAVPLQTVR